MKAALEVRGNLSDQMYELYRLVVNGTRSYDDVRPSLQRIIEGDFGGEAIQVSTGPSGLFLPPAAQIERTHVWNDERGWGIPAKQFAERLKDAPEVPTERLVAVVLVPYLKGKRGTSGVQRTFDELWAVVVSEQPNARRWNELKSDEKHLRLLDGITHEPGLRWEVIDLDAHRNTRVRDVRSPGTSPHAGILAAAAHHPNWVQAMDGKEVPYVDIPGYQASVDGNEPWRDVPCLDWGRLDRGVGLYAGWDGVAGPLYAVPAFRGVQS